MVLANVESLSEAILFADSSSQTIIRLDVQREKYFRTSELWMKLVIRTKVETSVPLMSSLEKQTFLMLEMFCCYACSFALSFSFQYNSEHSPNVWHDLNP